MVLSMRTLSSTLHKGLRRGSFVVLLLVSVTAMSTLSCSKDEATSTYSNREYVYCFFNVLQYTELFNVMGSNGQFATIRRQVEDGVTHIRMTCTGSSTPYPLDATAKGFGFGLGGLIVGTNYYGEHLCYDLACPICDRAGTRLTLDGIYAKCNHCGVTFDMNNYGVIYTKPEGAQLANPRGLYRYRINYDGQIVNAYN